MSSETGLSDTTTRLPVDIRRFPWIKPLAADYARDYARLADFFAGDPGDPQAWRAAIARAQQHPRQRAALASVILGQQQGRQAPAEAVAAGVRLADPRTVAVVTGQQPGLYGGPLFTLLKALTALGLAERTSAEHQVPAVAVFWIDAEDHDWHEVKSCGTLDATLSPVRVSLQDPPNPTDGPVAGVRLDDSATSTLEQLAAILPPTEFTSALLEDLRSAYAPGTGMAVAFGRWLESILGHRGLVVFDASDPAAKPLVAEIFAREIEHIGATSKHAADAGAALASRGYHGQVSPQPGHAALFHLNGGRTSIRADGGALLIDGTATTTAALVEEARTCPTRFSPNVLLRPIVQDTLFPTVCYVAGPSELAYLAQLREVYAAFGVPMPLVQQRASATILDANAMRFLQRHDLPLEMLRAQDEGALNQLLKAQIPPAVDASLEEAARTIADRLERLARAVAQLDPTLEAATRSALGRMQDDLKKLQGKIIQAAKRKDETVRRQFMHARAQAFPAGHPQEREVGLVYFLNKYGRVLVDRLRDTLPLEQGSHWVITI